MIDHFFQPKLSSTRTLEVIKQLQTSYFRKPHCKGMQGFMNIQTHSHPLDAEQLKLQIHAEFETWQHMPPESLLGASRHAFVTAHMERMSILYEQLQDLVGKKEAVQYLMAIMKSTKQS